MIEFIDILQSFGDQMIEYFWLPVIIWTLVGAPVVWILYKTERLQPIYQYHSRTALLLVLPLGLLGTYLIDTLNSATESAGTGMMIVIQNPITVSGATTTTSFLSSLSNPHFWLGAISIALLLGTGILLIKLFVDFAQLRKVDRSLSFSPLAEKTTLLKHLPDSADKYQNTYIAYSEEIRVPFTYGWLTTKIVVPANLKDEPLSLAMAVQHELIHIKNHDFLLNSFLVTIKHLFWFHPMIHHLYNSREEYREIICDSEVLANEQFSKKQYASLLFDLARQEHQQKLALSMAVNPSSLKKRIQIMSNSNNLSMNIRSSFLITCVAATLLTITISCTDMADDGITKSEVEQTQSQMANNASENIPLYIVNGEEWDRTDENKNKLSRLKTKYIKNINALKGDNATNEYGEKGKYGVIKMEVLTPEKAFSDLKEKASPEPSATKADEGDYYVTAEKMPELVGGLAALQQKITYPEKASEAGEEGRVIVQFIVDKNGNVENPTVVKGVSESLDKESIRVVKEAEFEPATLDGEPVRVQYSLPITYQLPSDSQK